MNDLDEHARAVREALRQAVAETLDRKRRLGQYAIFAIDGKPVRVEAAELPALESPPPSAVARALPHIRL